MCETVAAPCRRHDIADRVWNILAPLLPGGPGKAARLAQDNLRFIPMLSSRKTADKLSHWSVSAFVLMAFLLACNGNGAVPQGTPPTVPTLPPPRSCRCFRARANRYPCTHAHTAAVDYYTRWACGEQTGSV